MRVRAVDGLTGAPRPGEQLTVKTYLTSTKCTRTLPHELPSSDFQTDNAMVRSGRDGWATIELIDSQGRCEYRPDGVEVFVRGAGTGIDLKATGPVFIPVFDRYPKHDSTERTYTTYRSRDAFTAVAAVRSVYEERFVRVYGHVPLMFESGDTILVGATPEIHADGDGDDPFIRVALAKLTPVGTAWRIEMTALDLSPTAPEYIVPPAFASQRAQLAVWSKAMIDELVLRAATAAKLIDRHYLEVNHWQLVTRLDNPRFTSEILYDANPYDNEPAKKRLTVRGRLVRHDGRIVVEIGESR